MLSVILFSGNNIIANVEGGINLCEVVNTIDSTVYKFAFKGKLSKFFLPRINNETRQILSREDCVSMYNNSIEMDSIIFMGVSCLEEDTSKSKNVLKVSNAYRFGTKKQFFYLGLELYKGPLSGWGCTLLFKLENGRYDLVYSQENWVS